MRHGFNQITNEAKEILEDLGVPIIKETDTYYSIVLQETEDFGNHKVWLNPDDGVYWYLIRGKIFIGVPQYNYHIDSNGNVTKSVETILRWSNNQDLHRSTLESRPLEIERRI